MACYLQKKKALIGVQENLYIFKYRRWSPFSIPLNAFYVFAFFNKVNETDMGVKCPDTIKIK